MPSVKKTIKLLCLVLCELWHQFSLQFNLNKLLNHFFDLWISIHNYHHQPCNSYSNSMKRKSQILAVKVFSAITAIRTVVFALLTFTRLDQHWRVIMWDPILYMGAESYLNLAYFLYGLIGVYIYWRINFLHPMTASSKDRATIWLCVQYLREGDLRFKEQDSSEEKQIMFVPQDKGRQLVAKILRVQFSFLPLWCKCFNKRK